MKILNPYHATEGGLRPKDQSKNGSSSIRIDLGLIYPTKSKHPISTMPSHVMCSLLMIHKFHLNEPNPTMEACTSTFMCVASSTVCEYFHLLSIWIFLYHKLMQMFWVLSRNQSNNIKANYQNFCIFSVEFYYMYLYQFVHG